NFSYTRLQTSDNIEDDQIQNDFRITWTHSPQTKGTGRFSASVNAATASYNQNNYLGVDPINPVDNTGRNTNLDNTTRKLSSNVSYSKTFAGTPFSLAITARHNQDVAPRELGGGQVDLLLPSLTFNMSNIYPFRGKSGGNSWTDKITLRYSMVGSNNLTNNLGRIGSDPTQDSIAPFTFENLSTFLKNSNKGMRHQIPFSTSFRFLKHFTASPTINYEERWYFDKLNWSIDPENPERTIITDTIPGFNRVYNYNASIGIATRLYGTVNFKKGSLKAIRHVMNPSVSLSYQPDFGSEQYDYYQKLTTESGQEILRSRYQGYLYGTPPPNEVGAMSFSLSNTLEAKVKTEKDTTDTPRKVPILNNFGFNTSYNFVADSFRLAPISWRANTNIINKKVNINMNGSIDPYIYRLDSTGINSQGETIYYQRRVNEFAWNNGQGLGQLVSANLAISTNLNPKARESDEETRQRIIDSNIPEAEKDFLINNPDYYLDFNIPWSLRINYSLRYSKRGFQPAEFIQSIRLSGDFSLTEKWKITFNSGYDFEQNAFTQTNLGISRDLHCWEMNVNWTPFGFYQSYNFTIRVKSALLRDLKLNRSRTFYDR
ncbi:MAG: putative LPS assembly protein LptD, partial [Cyclobacteriaceae bacterium]